MSFFALLHRLAICGALLLGMSTVAHSATFIVTTTADTVDDTDGQTSLREAILAANTNGNPGVEDLINFAPGVTGTIPLTTVGADRDGNTPVGRSAFILKEQVRIQGPGADALTLTRASSAANMRFFVIASSATATLSGVTLSGGKDADFFGGGAISNFGTFTLQNSILTGNSSTSYGGGVANNKGTFKIQGCTITDNVSDTFGGGILNGVARLEVQDSTISNNTTRTGGSAGGIDNSGFLVMSNSTLSGNTSLKRGGSGALWTQESTILTNCTITNNSVVGAAGGDFGGVTNSSSIGPTEHTVTLSNTIVAGNQNNFTFPDIGGLPFISKGYNLIGNKGRATGFSSEGDQTGTTGAPLDPGLAPLAYNGGSTQTHALRMGSAAIDAGQTDLTTDQRGFRRPVGNADDIGAFEYDLPQTSSDFVVNQTDDHDDGQCSFGDCTLREALRAASDNFTSDPSNVTFDATVFAAKQTLVLTKGNLPPVTAPLSLKGLNSVGAGVTLKNTNSGTGSTLQVLGVSAQISNLTFTDGFNALSCDGSGADLTVMGCTFSGNGTSLNNLNGANLKANNCTIYGGTASNTLGLRCSQATATLNSCTITGNASGIDAVSGTVNLTNCLVAGNTTNISGTFGDGGHNMVNGTVSTVGLDPDGLQDNGGPTQTVTLLAASPAIDAGATLLTEDQRGIMRPQRGATDIGALEKINSAPVLSQVGLDNAKPTTNSVIKAVLFTSDADKDALTYTFVWKNGDTVLPETSDTLDLDVAGNGDKGDQITVTATVHDAYGGTSQTLTSKAVTVANSAPLVSGVIVSPDAPKAGDSIVATVTASDADRDALIYTYTWTRVRGNQSTLLRTTKGSKESTDTLPTKRGLIRGGDQIVVSVVASDGDLDSVRAEQSVTIANSAVNVTSIIFRSSRPTTNVLLYADVKALDNDDVRATITYTWSRTHNGRTDVVQTTTSTSSRTELDLSKKNYGDKGDTLTLLVSATDGQTTSTKSATIMVSNTPPVMMSARLSPTAPTRTSTLRAAVSAQDPDVTDGVDKLTYLYKWYDGTRYLTENKINALDLSRYPFIKKGDTLNLSVRASDGTSLSATLKTSIKIGSAPNNDASPSPSSGNS